MKTVYKYQTENHASVIWYYDPLPMVYQTLSYGIMNPSHLVEMRGVNLP